MFVHYVETKCYTVRVFFFFFFRFWATVSFWREQAPNWYFTITIEIELCCSKRKKFPMRLRLGNVRACCCYFFSIPKAIKIEQFSRFDMVSQHDTETHALSHLANEFNEWLRRFFFFVKMTPTKIETNGSNSFSALTFISLAIQTGIKKNRFTCEFVLFLERSRGTEKKSAYFFRKVGSASN